MHRDDKRALVILAGVIILAAAVFLIVYLPGSAKQSVSDRERPTSADASRAADGATVERGPGAPGRRDAASGRLLAGAESDEEAPDEDASDGAQKKRGKKKRRQRRGQGTEPDEGDDTGRPSEAKLHDAPSSA